MLESWLLSTYQIMAKIQTVCWYPQSVRIARKSHWTRRPGTEWKCPSKTAVVLRHSIGKNFLWDLKKTSQNQLVSWFPDGVLSLSTIADHTVLICAVCLSLHLSSVRGLVITDIRGPFESIARDAKVKLFDRIVAIEAWRRLVVSCWAVGFWCQQQINTHIYIYVYLLIYT